VKSFVRSWEVRIEPKSEMRMISLILYNDTYRSTLRASFFIPNTSHTPPPQSATKSAWLNPTPKAPKNKSTFASPPSSPRFASSTIRSRTCVTRVCWWRLVVAPTARLARNCQTKPSSSHESMTGNKAINPRVSRLVNRNSYSSFLCIKQYFIIPLSHILVSFALADLCSTQQ
jgi:hypothetical protein